MSYQIRHREFGVYQGSCIGLGFWHPTSEMPEQGFCEFPTHADAEEYVRFLCSDECDDPFFQTDLTIEPFDREFSEQLHREGTAALTGSKNK